MPGLKSGFGPKLKSGSFSFFFLDITALFGLSHDLGWCLGGFVGLDPNVCDWTGLRFIFKSEYGLGLESAKE